MQLALTWFSLMVSPSLQFSAAYKPTSISQAQGVAVHTTRPSDGAALMTARDLDAIADAGFKTVRMDMLWGQVEKQPGVFDFSRYDELIDAMTVRGLKPMVILGLGNDLYAEGLTAKGPQTAQAYQRYATEAVKHFAGKGVTWELVQSPDVEYFWQSGPNPNEYFSLVNPILPTLHQLDPSGHFIAPSVAGDKPEFLETLFRNGLLNQVDAVSIHPYQAPEAPEHFWQQAMQAKQLIERFSPPGKTIPLITGEWGYSTALGQSTDEQTQANYLVRQALLSKLLNSPLNITYDWKGSINGPNRSVPNDKEDHFGVVSYGVKPKPAYWAMREMTKTLAGQTLQGRILTPNADDYLLLFAGNGQKTLVSWTAADQPRVVSLDGHSLTLSGKPTYLSLATPALG